MRNTQKQAVVYCRVSSVKQTTRGDGLSSQETSCRQFARYRGYEVVKVFKDDISGKSVGRPGMKAMLTFVREHRKHGMVVIIDDISRLARDLSSHLQLRADIAKAGGTLESPSIAFGTDPHSQFMENIAASSAQHQRQVNAKQTFERMRARAMNGFWVFQAPYGYRFDKAPGGGKMLVRHEPLASIVTQALEGYASGRMETLSEVARFLAAQPEIPANRYGGVRPERARQMLTQPLYAGYVELPSWDVSLRKGQHEALISLETFNRIQHRLLGKVRGPSRADVNLDFPLRGFVACDDCGHPLTANWSRGQKASYPYYLCRQRGCESHGKSIARAKVEGALEERLKAMTPARHLVDLAAANFRDLWNAQMRSGAERKALMKSESVELDKKISVLVDRIVDSDNRTVIAALEKRINEMENRKHVLAEKMVKCDAPTRGFDENFRTAMQFLSSPWNLWKSDRLEDKRAVLKLTFAGELRYHRTEGLRTPKTSFPFKVLEGISTAIVEMARPAGFEPATSCLEGTCSIQLSYGRVGSRLYLKLSA